MTDGKYPLNGSHYTTDDDLEMLSHPEDWPTPLHVKRGHPAIADVVGVSDSTVRENLRVLHYGRVVERRVIGNAHEYRLREATT